MIYIQKNNDGIPHHFDCACAMYGAIDLGLEYKLISFEELKSGKWDSLIKSNLFIGSVEFMTEVFNRIEIKQPKLPLNNFRPFIEMKIKDFKNLIDNNSNSEQKYFIKPKEIKAFTGFVVDKWSVTTLNSLNDDLDIFVQEVIDIESEWRIYVFRNKVVDIRQYSGELEADVYGMVNFANKLLKNKEEKLKGFPSTFTIDMAIYKKYPKIRLKTVVEFNDMWAIGNYGISNDLYVKMLKERYFDIIKNKK